MEMYVIPEINLEGVLMKNIGIKKEKDGRNKIKGDIDGNEKDFGSQARNDCINRGIC